MGYLLWVTAILDPSGEPVKQYTYDEFGNLEESGEASFYNEVTFTGSVSDKSSGLQYMNARFYNPSTGRFINQDTYAGNAYDPWTQHLYAYTMNNPTNFVDPTGHSAELALLYMRRALAQLGENANTKTLQKTIANVENVRRKSKIANPTVVLDELPLEGEPNTSKTNSDGTKTRYYGSDGKAEKDKHNSDHGNSKRHPKVPHEHDWDWSDPDHPKLGPWYDGMSEPVPTQQGKDAWGYVANGLILLGAAAAVAWCVVNDVTIIGVLDNAAIPGLMEIGRQSSVYLFG